MYKNSKIAAIILIGGDGRRFNNTLPKQFHNLSGKKIYLHTLEKFQNLKCFDEIIVVCHKNSLDMVKKDLPSIKVVEGGLTRQESAYKGLLACGPKTDIVSIHDGVRPFVSEKIILENIEKAFLYGAVDTCIPSFDTIVQTFENSEISSIPKRDTLLRGQTPQTFKYKIIKQAHEKALQKGLKNISDDCRLVLETGQKVYIVKGDEHNIKITTQLDLFIAEQLLRLQVQSAPAPFLNLKDKIFVVVGGSGGIGSKICLELEKNMAKAVSLSRNSDIRIDLTDYNSIKLAFDKIYKKFGKVDGLINSAGLLKIKPLKKLSFREIEELIKVNYSGLVFCSKEAKIKKGGHIINIASSSYSKGRKNSSIYSSSKAAVVNFTQALAEEFSNLNVNTLVPQRTDTFMRRENFPKEDPSLLLSPKFVAKEVIKILSTKLTGSIIEVKKL